MQDDEAGSESNGDEADAQQRLDAVADDGDDAGRTETWGGDVTGELVDADAATLLSEVAQDDASGKSGENLHSKVDAAIETLEVLQATLE